jgi:hypothetical protein
MTRTVLAAVGAEGGEVAQRRICAIVVEVALPAGAVAGRRADVVVCETRQKGETTQRLERKS